MSRYVPFVPGITVRGSTLLVLLEFIETFSVLRQAIFEALDVGGIDPERWYPQENVLRAYSKVDALLGGRGLERVGRTLPTRAALPPGISDAHTVLANLDAVYHINHRRDGVIMFDPETGRQLEGIGHYLYEGRIGESEAVLSCDNPYPCRFDQGLFHGFVALFGASVTVTHEPESCRVHGDARCRYRARW